MTRLLIPGFGMIPINVLPLLTILQLYLTRTQNNAAGGTGAPQAVRVSGDPGPPPVRSGGGKKGSGNRYPGR